MKLGDIVYWVKDKYYYPYKEVREGQFVMQQGDKVVVLRKGKLKILEGYKITEERPEVD